MTSRIESPPIHRPEEVGDAAHPKYLERVYAGVLGKLIGVYLGRPVENWSYERIGQEFGEVDYYIHDQRGRRLIVTDDDLSGTFTFLRALEDYGYNPNLTPAQIGQTWLNYLIERTTILWWGGMGNSTEHTAYLRLKQGTPAPFSGSSRLNSKIVAEQIGGQIFVDGWGLICPGDPARAADFARRAASVSHDGEAIYGAQIVASLIAAAFVESDIDTLLDIATRQIPADCTIRRMIDDLRVWHATGDDWRENRARLEADYGYDKYPGNCHIVPNHGLIILGLLHGRGDFDRSMMIVNTCGWDTDCNSGNLGTILGVLGGLEGLENRDWRGPVADRLYLPSADPGRAITDGLREAVIVANAGRALAGLPPVEPKQGARFHFSTPGSVQGWQAESGRIENTSGVLRIIGPAVVATPTFIPPHTKDMVTGYVLVANPTLYPGQTVWVRLHASEAASGRLFVSRYGPEDESIRLEGPSWSFERGPGEVCWTIPEVDGYPIHEIGIELERGEIEVDTVDWQGVPDTTFPPVSGTMWARAWGKAVDRFEFPRDSYEFLTQNDGIGMLIQGHREWQNYRVEARLTPRMAVSAGLAVRVQGLRRFYAFFFGDEGSIRIEKCLDGRTVLAEADFAWEPFADYQVAIEARDGSISVFIDDKLMLQATDGDLTGGAFAFVVESGCLGAGTPHIQPLNP